MGQIYQAIDVARTIDKFQVKNFVETGTGIADSLLHVAKADSVIPKYSIEVMEKLYADNIERLQSYPNINLRLGYTYDELPEIIEEINESEESLVTLFFHDAHFPGADFGLTGYADEPDEKKRIPLEVELRIAFEQKRYVDADVFVIDDLRIYEDGPFQGGNWPGRHASGAHGIDFVFQMFKDTHHIVKSYQQQGFIILFPNWYFTKDELADCIIGDDYIIC